MSVEPAGPKQGRIEHIRSVGCRQDDHRLMTAEAIQLGEDLVEGLLPFVVATAEARASDPPDTSSSSMKMMLGASFLASSNRSRTRAAPTPTNSSMNSEAEME